MRITMARTSIERIRLTPHEEDKLAKIARRTQRTKSEVLRAGLEAEWTKLETAAERDKAWDRLIEFAELVPGTPKVRFGMK